MDISMMRDMLWYHENRREIERKHPDSYVAIYGERVIGCALNRLDAARRGCEELGKMRALLVKRAGEPILEDTLQAIEEARIKQGENPMDRDELMKVFLYGSAVMITDGCDMYGDTMVGLIGIVTGYTGSPFSTGVYVQVVQMREGPFDIEEYCMPSDCIRQATEDEWIEVYREATGPRFGSEVRMNEE